MNPALHFLTSHVWAMEPVIFGHLAQLVERHAQGLRTPSADITRIVAGRIHPKAGEDDDGGDGAMDLFMDEGSDDREPAMQIMGRTAIIPVNGVIARYASQVNGACQDQGRSADGLQADLSAALSDAGVDQVVLVIDSPGGTVAGTAETADAIRQVSAGGKQVIAWVDGCAASAAYWLASQCDEIVVSAATAQVGSIGVITARLDVSAADEKAGYKIQVFRSAALKAPGAFNEKLSKEQIAAITQDIGDLHAVFASAVQAGRGLTDEQLEAVTTGQMWTAEKAKSLGLIDRVGSLASTLGAVDPQAGAVIRDRAINRSQLRAQAQAATPLPPPDASAAGSPTPAAAAAPDQDTTMKITEKALAALVAAEPDHAALIITQALAGAEEPAITASITAAKTTASLAAIGAQVTALTAERDTLKASLATATVSLAALQVKHDKLAGFKTGTAPDVGAGDPATASGKTMDRVAFTALTQSDGMAAANFIKAGGIVTET